MVPAQPHCTLATPPDLTCKEAWDQYRLWVSSGVLVTSLQKEHSSASYSARNADLKQGIVHNRYISLKHREGMDQEQQGIMGLKKLQPLTSEFGSSLCWHQRHC